MLTCAELMTSSRIEGHAYSEDGFSWHVSETPAYPAAQHYTDGSVGNYGKRERPHLVFDPSTGQPTHLTNGVCLDGDWVSVFPRSPPRTSFLFNSMMRCLYKEMHLNLKTMLIRVQYRQHDDATLDSKARCNDNPYPGYFDYTFTTVAPLQTP